jgi:hypothetical protein
MATRPTKAAEYRRKAAECTEIVVRRSLDNDRREMETLALQWLELAERAERQRTD